MVHSGVAVYARYRTEGLGNFGTDTGAGTWYTFGRNTRMSGVRWNVNQTGLNQLDTIEVDDYYYGKNEGSFSVDWVLSNSQIFNTILDPKSPNAYDTNPYSANNNDVRKANSFQLEIGHRNDSVLTTYKGCIMQSLAIKTSVGEPVGCTASVMCGRQTIGTTGLQTDANVNTLKSNAANNVDPFTFADSQITVSPTNKLFSGTTNNVIQDIEINFNTNKELLWGLNSADAQDSFRKVMEITGRMTLAFEDKYALETCAGRSEFTSLSAIFTKGGKTLTIALSGIGLSEHSRPSISPEEVIHQEVSFQARRAAIAGFA